LIPLYHDPQFVFRFAEDRLIPRFHLDGVPTGTQVSLFELDPANGTRLGFISSGVVGIDGWVDLSKPMIVRGGAGFIVVPEFQASTENPVNTLATPQTLFSFNRVDSATEWQTVNDGVMGGVSQGHCVVTERRTLEFFGLLSLENNGGFASVRTKPKQLGLLKGDVIQVRIRGDGREYSMNLYISKPLMAFSYRAKAQSKTDEGIELELPLDQFVATSFGREVRNAGPVTASDVNALGFMLADKQPGPFKLEIEWIKILRRGE
jgi:NADH dehydrogenase [ubiquinone] 1 alpha subcomplex assembly factor 1